MLPKAMCEALQSAQNAVCRVQISASCSRLRDNHRELTSDGRHDKIDFSLSSSSHFCRLDFVFVFLDPGIGEVLDLVQLVLHDLEVQLHHVVAAQPLKVVRHSWHMQIHLQQARHRFSQRLLFTAPASP